MTTLKTTATARANEAPPTPNITQLLAQNWWAFAIRGVLGIIFGLIAILQPGLTANCWPDIYTRARAIRKEC